METLTQRARRFLKKSDTIVCLHAWLVGKAYRFSDWWGTVVWRRTSEVRTPQGFRMRTGLHPAYRLMRTGRFEVEETALVQMLLQRVDLFVDVGANVGYYTCLALSQGKRVVAFEPQPRNVDILLRNLRANGWGDGVEVHALALGARAGVLDLYGASGPLASLVPNWAGYSPRYHQLVPGAALDDIVAARFANQRMLVKIDVEGAEYQVLRGAEATLRRVPRPLWLMEICLHEHHPGGANPDYARTFELFWRCGYEAYAVTSARHRVTREDVGRWLAAGRSGSGTINYLFADPGEALP